MVDYAITDDLGERLKALLRQEATIYGTADYMPSVSGIESSSTSSDDEYYAVGGPLSNQMNEHWRKKMCEWAYDGKTCKS